jgi:hypothetical protein
MTSYYGVDIPPMVMLPLNLRHPSDPIQATWGRARRKASPRGGSA